jgi:sterol desaturase/sphingolipid hydroxylase (fatty acid hydroxylase superfamily)
MSTWRRIRTAMAGDATLLAIPVFLGTVALEAIVLRRNESTVGLHDPDKSVTSRSNVERPVGYEAKDTATSLAMGVGMLAIGFATARVLGPLDRLIFSKRFGNVGGRRFAFAGAVLVWDFIYYWDHRMSHEHRIFWASHVNHHSSERYNLSTALRQPWTNIVTHGFFFPMLMAGFSPAQVARAGELNLLYQYWVHTETIDKLPRPVEYVMNTASHHRAHHGANKEYLDRNYGGIFIIWDRMFGSFEPERARVKYGLTKNIDTFNPFRVAFHEWAAIARNVAHAKSWRDRCGYVFGPPGWTPVA